MIEVAHYTSSGVVLDGNGNVLLIHHRNHGRWLCPGGEIEADEDPLAGAAREVREETGIDVEPIGAPNFEHPSLRSVLPPFAVLDMMVTDRRLGYHRHISFVYVFRPVSGDLTPQLAEVSDAAWVPIDQVSTLEVPDDLPALVTAAAGWAAARV
ncbi:NUDIX hydrolase [Rhizocola hellebori]|uniref:NUDIX hydrolase n=1 Tax=Rhizocola hellebori TaxID=1392758 RepID=UPI0019409C59|nr:NUDIX domain-containing protein [Rhizocola hellebori]